MASQDWFEKDFYAVLGISPTADAKQIKKRYRKLARDYHPDSKPGDTAAEQRFKEIGEAYAVLSDPEERKQYDAVRSMARGGARFTAGGPGGAEGFEDVFSNLFGGPGASGPGGTRFTYTTGRPNGGFGGPGGPGGFGAGGPGAGGATNLEDLLGMFGGAGGFGDPTGPSGPGGRYGGPGSRTRAPAKGRDRQATATLSFRQAVAGDVVEVRGTDGTTSKVRIHPGVKDGATIRVRGKGDPGPTGAPAGDLLITITVRPHEVFGRDGDNLSIDVPVTFAEAALGGTVSVPTLGGAPVKVKLAPGTPSGRVLRVKARGVPTRQGPGDLLVKVQIVVPQRLSDDMRRAVEVLAEHDQDADPRAEMFRKAAGG
ncbi:MAG TPA: DnaJ C-terminal domain-containing protein [Dermatophilaceae bacterium]|nr:DnaJ C-terminal domain-containing protein [Dermatophilaceae bacterium]